MRNKRSPNEFITKGKYTLILLYNHYGEMVDVGIFDTKNLSKVKKFKWSRHIKENTSYILTSLNDSYQRIYNKTQLYLHQLILPCSEDMIIDHKNHNGLDNRQENLRVVTRLQNCENRINANIKPVGVSWHKRVKAWNSRIKIKNKTYNLGYFSSIEDAADARIKFKDKHCLI